MLATNLNKISHFISYLGEVRTDNEVDKLLEK